MHNNGKDILNKFNAKFDKELFIGYSFMSKTFWVYNKITLQIKGLIHIIFNESTLSVHKNDDDKEIDSQLH